MTFATTTAAATNITGSISGTTLTVTAPATNSCQPGYILNGVGVTTCTVVRQLTGTQNGAGTYEVTVSQTVASTTINPTIRTHTQTGTDTSWLGLSGLTGITKIFGAVGVIYQVDSARIALNGTFTCTPRSETVLFTNSPLLEIVTGAASTVTIAGNSTGSGGLTDYTTSPFMQTTRNCSGYNGSSAASFFVNGVLNWLGGTHLSDGAVYFATPSTVTIDNAYATWLGGAANSFYIATTNIVFNGPLYCTGKRLAPLVTALTLTGFAPRNTAAGLDGGNANQYLTLVDFQPYNTGIDIYQRNSNGRIIYGSSKGMSTTVQNPLVSGASWQGVAILMRNVAHTAADPSGSSIEGAKIYSLPINDGNRADLSAFGPALPIFDFTNAPAQNWLTVTGGTSTAQPVKLKGWWVNNTTTPANSSNVTRYTKGGDDTATYDFFACSYNHFLSTATVTLNGIGTYTNPITLSVDTSITQSSIATVAAYTTLDTSAQFYDYAKYYLYQNFAGQTAPYVTIANGVINAGNYNVVIDAAAAAPFALSGNTLTINSTEFTGSIVTTGAVSTVNGAAITGAYTDSSGAHVSLSINSIVVGSRVLIRRTDTNANLVNDIATSSTYKYEYVYSSDVPIEIVLRNASGSPAYQEFRTTGTLTLLSASITANQVLDQ